MSVSELCTLRKWKRQNVVTLNIDEPKLTVIFVTIFVIITEALHCGTIIKLEQCTTKQAIGYPSLGKYVNNNTALQQAIQWN